MADWQALRDWCHAVAQLDLPDRLVDQLRVYVDLLRLWNRKISLVASAEPDVVLTKHLADSLFAAAHCRKSDAVVDLGSGAGFPGLVIGMVAPAARVTLIEARGRKVSFLEEVCRVAALSNVKAVHGRIEAVAAEPRHHGVYEIATARALADLSLLRTLAAPLLRDDGLLLAMRTPSASTPHGAKRITYALPDGTARALLIESRARG